MKETAFAKPLVALSLAAGILLVVCLCIAAYNFLAIKYRGSSVPVPDIPRNAETFGEGAELRYAVLGDSTTVAQGASYDEGYARATARHLASKDYRVTLQNFGVSGAVAKDVADRQVREAVSFKPDIVLIAAGANDVTHLTSPEDVATALGKSIDALRVSNPSVRIVVTGAPDMGSIPRFSQPTRYLAGKRTTQINTAVIRMAEEKKAVFAPIAEKTGPIFAAHPEYFAADLFHPTAEGYAVWVPVLNEALQTAAQPW